MANWFECKIRYSKILETGLQKTVTENYLVDALSFTEAEARITEEMSPYISGEFTVSAVKREKISDVFYDATGDKWYKVKTNFITIDKGTLADFEIASIVETPLMDVFPADLSGKKAAAQKPIE